MIPAWAFGSTLAVLAAGAFVMQMGVQGAWGIIPVHLNELSPDAVRGLLPGFTYQIGFCWRRQRRESSLPCAIIWAMPGRWPRSNWW